MISLNENLLNRVMGLPEPFMIDVSDSAVAVGTGRTYNVPFPTGFLYLLKGMDVNIAGNQIFEGAFLDTAVVANQFLPTKTQTGAGVRLSKNRIIRYPQTPLVLFFSAAGGAPVVGANIMDDFEFPMNVTITRAYWHAGTTMGAVAFTVDITVGAAAAVTILNNAAAGVVVMEAENLNINVPADTDVLIEYSDAAGNCADQTLVLWYEINEEQVDLNENEYIPLTFHHGPNAGALTNIMNPVEVPEDMVIRRAYCQVAVAPGGGQTVDFFVNGYDLGCQIAGAAAVIAENENLNVALPANVDILVEVTDTAAASVDYTVVLWCQRTTPLDDSSSPPDIRDVFGDIWVQPGDNIVIQYNQGTTLQTSRTICYGSRFRLRP